MSSQPVQSPCAATAPPPVSGAEASPATVTVSRRIKARATVLFDAWLDAKSLGAWLHPGTSTHSTATTDPVVGGRYRIDMYQPDRTIEHHGEYVAIERPHRLVFTWASPGTYQRNTLVTVSFVEADGVTDVSITHEQLPAEMAAGHTAGWTDGLESLAAYAG